MDHLFLLLVVYQFKHFFADYPLQGPYMLKKFLGGWEWVKPLAAHAGVHAAFTFLVSSVFMWSTKGPTYTSLFITLGVTVFDFVIHLCMDRLKASPNLLGRYKALSGAEFVNYLQKLNAAQCGVKQADEMLVKVKTDADKDFWKNNKVFHQKDIDLVVGLFKSNTYFWWSLGLDQMVHHLTHYCIIAVLVLS